MSQRLEETTLRIHLVFADVRREIEIVESAQTLNSYSFLSSSSGKATSQPHFPPRLAMADLNLDIYAYLN